MLVDNTAVNIIHITAKDFNKQLAKNFIAKEFACKDGTQELFIDTKLVEKLQEIRDYYDTPIKVISGYRTENYNLNCGGAKNSKHLTGEAIDFMFLKRPELLSDDDGKIFYTAQDIQNKFKINGIGIYNERMENNFLHIDNRDKKLVWVSNKKQMLYYNDIQDYLLGKIPVKVV